MGPKNKQKQPEGQLWRGGPCPTLLEESVLPRPHLWPSPWPLPKVAGLLSWARGHVKVGDVSSSLQKPWVPITRVGVGLGGAGPLLQAGLLGPKSHLGVGTGMSP